MANEKQVDAVKEYLRQRFASGDVSMPSVEYGARFRVSQGEKSYDLQVGPPFENIDVDSLSRWMNSHYIAQRMRACGPRSTVNLTGLSKEPICTCDPIVAKQDKVLLSRIRQHIVAAGETISSEKSNERTATHFFEIGRDRLVQVDRSFLDADDGLDATLGRLDGWRLGDLLAKMRDRDKLVITKEGSPSIMQS
jgi:hypothetical protein